MSSDQPKISSWRLTGECLKQTFTLYPQVVKSAWGWLIALHVIQVIASQMSSYSADNLRASGREDLGLIVAIAGIDMVFTLIWSAFWVLTLSLAAHQELAPQSALQRPKNLLETINQILVEQTRTLAAILWRAPLIVPAGIQWVRLTFVPFIVIFDPDYDGGRRDALKGSQDLSQSRFWLLNLYLLAAGALPWMAESVTQGEKEWLWENPVKVGLTSILTLLINIATGLFLFSLYRRLASMTAESGNEAPHADLQLERN